MPSIHAHERTLPLAVPTLCVLLLIVHLQLNCLFFTSVVLTALARKFHPTRVSGRIGLFRLGFTKRDRILRLFMSAPSQ